MQVPKLSLQYLNIELRPTYTPSHPLLLMNNLKKIFNGNYWNVVCIKIHTRIFGHYVLSSQNDCPSP